MLYLFKRVLYSRPVGLTRPCLPGRCGVSVNTAFWALEAVTYEVLVDFDGSE